MTSRIVPHELDQVATARRIIWSPAVKEWNCMTMPGKIGIASTLVLIVVTGLGRTLILPKSISKSSDPRSTARSC